MAFSASFVLVGSIVLCLAIAIYKALTNPLRHLPGPWYTTFTNLHLKLAVIKGERIYHIQALHQRYGSIVRISPYEAAVSDLAAFRQTHRAGSGFEKSPWYEKFTQSGTLGVFSMRNAKQHAQRRKLFARPFSKSELRRNWEGVVREKCELWVERMKTELESEGETDLLKWSTFLATDVSGHLMFGKSFEMLEYGRKDEYIRVLEYTMMGSGIASELPFVQSIGKWIPTPTCKAMFRSGDYLFGHGKRAIANAKSLDGNSKSIFTGMITESEKSSNQATLSEHDVVQEASNLIVAGSDTTAVTLTYLIWAVASRPALRLKLEEELAILPDGFEDAQLEDLPLLNAVINETLRLYGAAPGALPRIVPEGGAKLGDYVLPTGTVVLTQSWTLHREPVIFSKPDEFDPLRWLLPNEMTENARAAFTPFGAGARICLGIHLAMMELRIATASFYHSIKGVRPANRTTTASMKPQNHFLIAPQSHECFIAR